MDDNSHQGRMSVGSIGSLFGNKKTRLRPPSVIVTADEDENTGNFNVVAGFGRIGRKNGNIPGIGQEGANNEATTSGAGTEAMQASDLPVLPRKQEGKEKERPREKKKENREKYFPPELIPSSTGSFFHVNEVLSSRRTTPRTSLYGIEDWLIQPAPTLHFHHGELESRD